MHSQISSIILKIQQHLCYLKGFFMQLILASASPRRKQLLTEALPEIELTIEPADIDETRFFKEPAKDYVMRMATKKAMHVAGKHPDGKRWVLAADTIVVHKGQILGKPYNVESAREMLLSLSDDVHTVMTAVCLVKGEQMETFLCETEVKFAKISPERIRRYIESGEPMDKAGAYGIQGKAGAFVEWIKGSYTNVVGLPVAQTIALLVG